ncbi:50S ribosomal protein L6 [Zancudomyces culisetae]|uniref:50S ribosomal protein L6 n=1 Tax=Zancudomyces culisetae TaxID=1213189 RepID=A0A1R1PGL7_ZANCU|nr:50S ribosomal protein L6 [Zancudomyces culisetae]OMH82579.1 50S ribosomal protein L6 [Zancudomyces culisetae]|eukprot:OMH80120.1 50S ribosomal protein L6 [Zancudomyces culisetae]
MPIKYGKEVEIIHAQEVYRPDMPKFTTLKVKGPLGELKMGISPNVKIEIEQIQNQQQSKDGSKSSGQENEDSAGGILTVSAVNQGVKEHRQMWGTTRALINNMVTGVTEGFITHLRMVGTGYRASMEKMPKSEVLLTIPKTQDPKRKVKHVRRDSSGAIIEDEIEEVLQIRLGYSHPVNIQIPEGLTVQVPNPTSIIVRGLDLQQIGLFAAKVRKLKKPEPYKQKGIFVNDETIKKKDAKKK